MKRNTDGNNYPTAVVREVDGKLVLDDPEARGVISAVNKANCENTFNLNLDRIKHFVERAKVLKRSPDDTVIVVINVDDVYGYPLAEVLMPNTNWQVFRDRGEIPFARGLATKDGVCGYLKLFDDGIAASKLEKMTTLAVVVIDFNTAEVYPAPEV